MWPMLLNLTRDECRLTLRRLELEAYSNMVNVFRAQGALEDNRKKLLEELRAVLHISHDRHSAEARRVSNDQLLATIADQLSGPNTGLGWICEGRRRIPLLPRGIPQTAYTEIADRAAEIAIAENKEIQKRLEDKLVAPKSSEEEIPNAEEQNAESELSSSGTVDEVVCPPIAMEDQTLKLWDTELITRKRKVPEGSPAPDDVTTPIKTMRNIPVNSTQKHLDLTQIYSKFSQPPTSKPASQSKHSYNQVSKVSSKSNQSHAPRSAPQKSRAPKAPKQAKARTRKVQREAPPLSPGKQYNQLSMQLDYAGPPNTFQASYAQSVLGTKPKSDYDDVKSKVMSSAGMMADSPTMQLLTQPATVPHELEVPETHPDDVTCLQAQSAPLPKVAAGKQQIIKSRLEATPDKKPSEVKVLQKPMEGIKVLSNRQVTVAPASTQKVLSAPMQKVLSTPTKLVTTKVIGSVPKSRTPSAPVKMEQMIVVSKPTPDSRNLASSRLIVTSAASTAMKERTSESLSNVARLTESLTPKGIPATDLKVSAKALVLNPKGQKMLVVPSKARTKPGTEHDRKLPLIHFRGIPTAMKLVPVSQSVPPVARSSTVTVLSKPAVGSLPSTPKIIGMETIKTANLADIVPVKGLTPVTTPKITNPIVRPSSAKGNVIVVQKGTPIGKALTFAKNGNDMSKIIMGKNVTQLLQASKNEHPEAGKPPGNVIVLELNNEQSGRPTTMSEILDSRAPAAGGVARVADKPPQITPDTPVLFDTQLTEETCNTSSLDSTVESIAGITPIEGISIMEKDETKSQFGKDSEGAKDSSSVTDWEMELDTVSRKDKDDDKLNSLHLDLGMSSDSDGEYMGTGRKRKGKHPGQPRQHTPTSGESGGVFSSSSAMSLATRTLLSQLQDEGSSSNDSSFALKTKAPERAKLADTKLDKVESDELTKAKEKLSEKVAEARSQQRRIDVYSTAIAPSDINLDSFAYLDEGMLAGDDVFASEEVKAGVREARREHALDDQLRRLLAEDCASAGSPVTEPLNK